MRIFALHGFLGSPADWNILSGNVGLRHDLNTPDLFSAMSNGSMEEWARAFNGHVKKTAHSQNGSVLIGYSLGGRLALHALVDDPSVWSGAVIVSAQSGLADEKERQARLEGDMRWAARLEQEEWHRWISDWNSQAIFRHDPPMERTLPTKERRQMLAFALQNWSLGRQNDLSRRLSSLNLPILWMVGAKDDKYLLEAGRMSFSHPLSRRAVIEGAGHRVPWGKTKEFIEHIEQFINDLEEIK